MPYRSIPNKSQKIVLSQINKNNTNELFKFFVFKMIQANKTAETFNFLQLNQIVFNGDKSGLLNRVINNYAVYFKLNRHKKYEINWELIYAEHNHFWTNQEIIENSYSEAKDQILRAVKDEIIASKKTEESKYYIINNIELVGKKGSLYVYHAIINIENDDNISITEGLSLKYIQDGHFTTNITALDFDSQNLVIAFQTSMLLSNVHKKAKIQIKSAQFIENLYQYIYSTDETNAPIWQLFKINWRSSIVNVENKNIWIDSLDESQKNCIDYALNNNITFIWGPPGTGKSHTLARLILNLYEQGEKTLVSSIANVAVDNLLLKTIDLLDKYRIKTKRNIIDDYKIIRLGYSQSNEIREIPQIIGENDVIKRLTSEILQLENTIENLDVGDKKSLLLSQLYECKKKYDQENAKLVSNSRLLFLTSSKYCLFR